MRNVILTTLLLVAPAGAQAPAPVLRVSAPVGVSAGFLTSTSSRLRFSDVQVTAMPGMTADPATVNRVRNGASRGLAAAGQTVTQSGKLYVRVAGRSEDDVTTLVSSVVGSTPASSVRVTQQVGQDGQINISGIESDNPQLRAVFQQFTPEQLRQWTQNSGAGTGGPYGQPLVAGTSSEQRATIDMQGVVSGVFTTLASTADAARLFGTVQATPLTITTRTTYHGVSAQGLHTYTTRSAADDWTVELGEGGDLPAMTMTLRSLAGSGTQTYRADGLPAGSTLAQTLTLRMTVPMPGDGVQLGVTMTVEQRVAVIPR